MLFEQKSRRKSYVEIIACPYKYSTQLISSLDFLHDFLRSNKYMEISTLKLFDIPKY